MKRIAIVGPVVPFRGGIAHHTTRLAQAIGDRAQTHVFSYTRLYPAWLYPGRFQIENTSTISGLDAKFVLDSLNPVTWQRTASALLKLNPDAVIIPWWTFFLAPQIRYLGKRLSRAGIPLHFMCHNVLDHEAVWWKKRLSKWAISQGFNYIVHSPKEANLLQNLLPGASTHWLPHPPYDRFKPPTGSKPRRGGLELLYFGFIRPYKGLDVLLESITHLNGLDFYLSIVGEPWGHGEEYWLKRIQATGVPDRIEFVPRYVTDLEASEYFQRADAVVLPYRAATGTGVAAIALHYRRPIIGSNVSGLSEIVENGRGGLLVPPGDSEALASAIRKFWQEGMNDSDSETNTNHGIREPSWDRLANLFLDAESSE